MTALALAQAPAGDGSDTTVIVAVVGAVGLVLAALVTALSQRTGARLDAIEKSQGALGAAIDRLERRMEDGLARLADRIDRLYGSAPAGPATTARPPSDATEDAEALRRFVERIDRAIAGEDVGPIGSDLDTLRKIVRLGGMPPPPAPQSEISAAELSAQLRDLRQAVEAYSEQQQEQENATSPTEEGRESWPPTEDGRES